ncbi:hypothetical protein Leryth_000313 [Lithospermum erythrorhizon]|nr:hypothetical protein Leryth_000313 [Lithospermum erythrorhizon]
MKIECLNKIELKVHIDVRALERQIFGRLLEVINHFNLQTNIRIAAGWLRDKKFSTPTEDAFRRDLTINSLSYSISTNVVEDFTERGLSDLKSGKIVTPLPPKQTFLDDPLRVLRSIGFGARFGLSLMRS